MFSCFKYFGTGFYGLAQTGLIEMDKILSMEQRKTEKEEKKTRCGLVVVCFACQGSYLYSALIFPSLRFSPPKPTAVSLLPLHEWISAAESVNSKANPTGKEDGAEYFIRRGNVGLIKKRANSA